MKTYHYVFVSFTPLGTANEFLPALNRWGAAGYKVIVTLENGVLLMQERLGV